MTLAFFAASISARGGGSTPANFILLNANDYSGHTAASAGRPVLPHRMEAPWASMRADFPHNLPAERVFLPTAAFLYPGADPCTYPDTPRVVERLHGHRPPSFSGHAFPDLESGCFENFKKPETVEAYDPIYAAWLRTCRVAWPNCTIHGYFLPGNSSEYGGLRSWNDDGTPPDAWALAASKQVQTLAEVDVLMPELYFSWSEPTFEANAYQKFPVLLNKYRMALEWIVEHWPNHKVMPITWLSIWRVWPAWDNPPCQPFRSHDTWDGKTGDAPKCGFYSLPPEQILTWLRTLSQTGVDGFWFWGTATDYGMWQGGHPAMHTYAAVRQWVEEINA